ncbi:hypothetical protein J6590_104770, partial [Homalodisca vitripennis]
MNNGSDSPNISIKELEHSLIENNFFENTASEEGKLEMAAKIGSVLLNENNTLKEQNIRLKAELASCEEQIEELNNEKERYTERLEALQRCLDDMQTSLDRETQLRRKNQDTFDEHECKMGQIIDDYICKMNEKDKIIKTLQVKFENQININMSKSTISTASQTQGIENDPSSATASPYLLLQILNINKKQENMENMMIALSSQLQQLSTNQTKQLSNLDHLPVESKPICTQNLNYDLTNPGTNESLTSTPGARQTCRQKLNESTLTNAYPTSTPGARQTCRQKLNRSTMTKDYPTSTPGARQTCRQKLSELKKPSTNNKRNN